MTAAAKKHVLFVDDDKTFLETAGQLLSLRSQGRWQLHTADTPARALAILQNLSIDLVIVDIQMPVVDGEQFLQLLGRSYPHIRKVVLSGFATDQQRSTCLQHGAELCLEKPRSADGYESIFATLNELLALPHQEGFRGMLRQVGLPDVIQMECLGRNSSILEVRCPEGRGQIFIENGLIVHAHLGDKAGEEAFNRLLSLRGGDFHLLPFQPPPSKTIEGQWEFLLMEAARQRDELASVAASDPSANRNVPVPPKVNSLRGEETVELPPVERQIAEFLVLSGDGEVLHQWQCEQLDIRLRLLSLIKEKARLLARTLPLGEFDRVEMLEEERRLVARLRPDRQMLVLSIPVLEEEE